MSIHFRLLISLEWHRSSFCWDALYTSTNDRLRVPLPVWLLRGYGKALYLLCVHDQQVPEAPLRPHPRPHRHPPQRAAGCAYYHGLGLRTRRTRAMAPSAPAGIYGATLGIAALTLGFSNQDPRRALGREQSPTLARPPARCLTHGCHASSRGLHHVSP